MAATSQKHRDSEVAKNPSEYDGSVFKTTESVADDPAVEFDRLNDAGSQLPDRDDASGWSSMILSEVESWLSSEAAENASDATMATAKDLALACRVAVVKGCWIRSKRLVRNPI